MLEILKVIFIKTVEKEASQGMISLFGCRIPMPLFIGGILGLIGVILTIIAMYHIHFKRKREDEKKEEERLKERVSKLEGNMETLTNLYPQLKSLEKLEDFENLKLTEDDIRKIVSEILKTTNVTPEAIDTKIDEKITKRLSEFDKGIAMMTAQKLSEIDKQFDKLVGNASDYLTLGITEYFEGNYLTAIENYDKAIQVEPDYAPAWNNKGVALGKLGHWDEALKAHEKAIELRPDYANAWDNKGVTLNKLGRWDEALKAQDKAIELKPTYTNAWNNKGGVLIKLDRVEEALQAFDKAVELEPNYAGAWSNRGIAFNKLGRWDEALKAHDKAIGLRPKFAPAWFNKACMYALRNDKDNALKNLSKAISLDPGYKEEVKEDEDFKNLWDDEDFKKIVS